MARLRAPWPRSGGLTGEQIEHEWFRYAATLSDGPLTLLHGDVDIPNTYVLPGDRVGFLDWQVLRRGEPRLSTSATSSRVRSPSTIGGSARPTSSTSTWAAFDLPGGERTDEG